MVAIGVKEAARRCNRCFYVKRRHKWSGVLNYTRSDGASVCWLREAETRKHRREAAAGVQHLRDAEAAGQAWGLGCAVCFSAAKLQGKLSSSCSPYVLCTKGASGVRRKELLQRLA